MPTKSLGLIGGAVIIAIVAVVALTSGGDDNEAQASEVDGAFVAGMVPHHDTAIEMAHIAQKRGEHAQITQLADDVVTA